MVVVITILLPRIMDRNKGAVDADFPIVTVLWIG